MNKIKVGQKVWVKPPAGHSFKKEPAEAVVTKVGRLYFWLDGHRYKYAIKNLEGLEYHAGRVYLSLQDILDENEVNELYREIRGRFYAYSNGAIFTLEQLRSIAEIIGVKNSGK